MLLLAGCKTGETPEEVTKAFWHALAVNDLETAKKYATKDSQNLIASYPDLLLDKASFETGETQINDDTAKVDVSIKHEMFGQNQLLRFKTFLSKQNGLWKVDYQQTLANMPGILLGSFFEILRNFSKNFSDQMEQQLPMIEKLFESFGEQLNKQIEEFNRQLEKPFPPEKNDPYRDTI